MAAAAYDPGERLDYTFSYLGILSGFIVIDISHARFVLAPQPLSLGGRPVYRASLDVTTEPFAEAELIYPFRYRYRSWLEPTHQTPLLAQEYLRADEIEEELLWFDRGRDLGFRYKKNRLPAGQRQRLPASLSAVLELDPQEWILVEDAHGQPLPAAGVWDYLSMLYRLRFAELATGRSLDLPVYNGKQIKTYRIEVMRERLIRGGWDRPAFKLSLFEVRQGKRRGDKITTIWISDDAQRRPLRFRVARVLGVFEGILETGRPSTAGDGELPEATRHSLELVF